MIEQQNVISPERARDMQADALAIVTGDSRVLAYHRRSAAQPAAPEDDPSHYRVSITPREETFFGEGW